jgi:hypothetical protein
MRTLGFCLFVVLPVLFFAGCATVPAPAPLSAVDVIALSKDGKSAKDIIAELQRTNTVIPLRASDYVALHDQGVPDEVLNYLQLAQIEDVRWRERSLYWGWGYGGPGWGYGWGPCRYRGRWGC